MLSCRPREKGWQRERTARGVEVDRRVVRYKFTHPNPAGVPLALLPLCWTREPGPKTPATGDAAVLPWDEATGPLSGDIHTREDLVLLGTSDLSSGQ